MMFADVAISAARTRADERYVTEPRSPLGKCCYDVSAMRAPFIHLVRKLMLLYYGTWDLGVNMSACMPVCAYIFVFNAITSS